MIDFNAFSVNQKQVETFLNENSPEYFIVETPKVIIISGVRLGFVSETRQVKGKEIIYEFTYQSSIKDTKSEYPLFQVVICLTEKRKVKHFIFVKQKYWKDWGGTGWL